MNESLQREFEDFEQFQVERLESEIQLIWNDMIFYLDTIRQSKFDSDTQIADWQIIRDHVTMLGAKVEDIVTSANEKRRQIKSLDRDVEILFDERKKNLDLSAKSVEEKLKKIHQKYIDDLNDIDKQYKLEGKKDEIFKKNLLAARQVMDMNMED